MAYAFHPFEVTAVHIIYVGLGLFICIFSYLSLFIKERLYLGEAPIAAAFGVIVGPVAIGLFNPAGWGNEDGVTPGGHTTDEITLEVMRVTIALSVFAIGVELPKKYLLRHWKSIAILLGPVMAWGWLISAAFIYALIPGLDFLNSLVVAACVSPTDPILAQAVVGGPWAEKHVPAHVRHMLMCESGCNDGAAFPFLYLALYLTQNRDNKGHAIAQWFYETWAYEIILGTILGALIGYLARKFMRFSERHKLIDRESFVAQYISLAIASMGVNVLLGSDDLLAAFACGTAFAWDGWFTKQTEDSNFSNIVDLLFNIATFIYIGALVPWHSFADATIGLSVWRLVVLAICVLLTKRLPIILALWKFIPDVKTFREAVFSGHFGPMGVGAIFIATLGRTLMPEEVAEPPETSNDVLALTIQPIVYFFVVCSILVHGFTVPFFAFGKNARKRAHTLTRTWSRNPSMRDDEPSWMNRVRRVKTGDDIVINHDDIAADKMSAQQLAMIGRGAIGGYREDELRRDSSNEDSGTAAGSTDSPDRTHSFVGLLNRKTELDLEKAQGENSEFNEKTSIEPAADHDDDSSPAPRPEETDGIEDYQGDEEHFDPSCDYLGDNCIEMKRYKQKLEAQKLAAKSGHDDSPDNEKRMQDEEQDIGEAPMDRDIICGNIQPEDEDEDCREDHEGQARLHHSRDQRSRGDKEGKDDESDEEDKWPRHRDWVEGNDLVLEYQKSYSDDPVVEVIHLSDEERDAMESSSTPAHDWVKQHHEELGGYLGHDEHSSWDATQTARHLVENKVSSWWPKKNKKQYIAAEAPPEETREEREARLNMMYGAMSWASDRRGPDEDVPKRQTRTQELSSDADNRLESSPAVVQTRAGGRGGEPIGPRDSSVPVGSTSAQDKPKRPSSRRRSSSSSRSPTPTASTRIATAGRGGAGSIGSLGSKRGNLRKKVLCGQIGLSGRRKSSTGQDQDYDDSLLEDPSESEPSTADSASIAASSTKTSASTPRVMISEPASPSRPRSKYSMRSSPSSSFKGVSKAETKGKDREKFFPRSSSAGAGLAPSYRGPSMTSGSPILKPSAPPSRQRTNAGPSSGEQDPSKETSRSSSIQWLDIAESRDRSQPYGHNRPAEPDSPKMSRRTRTHSGATSFASSSGEKELKREGRVRDPDDPSDDEDDDEFAEDDDDEGDRSGGGRGLRDGMSRIGAFFSNFTAPKGEGMGNPGPTSHPHLFPQHPPSRTKEENEREKDRNRSDAAGGSASAPDRSPARSRRLQREPTDEPETLSLPPPSVTDSQRSAPRVMLNIPNQDEPVWPGHRFPA